MKEILEISWYEGYRVPLLLGKVPAGWGRTRFSDPLMLEVVKKTGTLGLNRGVSAESLKLVLQNGIDVEPTESPIFAVQYIDKALEYGCNADQIVMVFDPQKVSRTWVELDAGSSTEEINKLQAIFPTRLDSRDGKIWLSKFNQDDGRLATSYEINYGFFVPGDPWNSLIFLMYLSDREIEISRSRIDEALAEISRAINH